jgi:RNA-directed DNA polymerase
MTTDRTSIAAALAAAFLDTKWTSTKKLAKRGAKAIGVKPKRVRPIAREVTAGYRLAPLDRRRELADYIGQLSSFEALFGRKVKRKDRPRVRRRHLPVAATTTARWPVPRLDTVLDLAHWAELTTADLDWYADVKSLERASTPRLRHYDRRWIYNRRGGVRLLEAPRPRTKALQRRVLHEVFDLVPVHDAAHGFVTGRSVSTYAAPHVGRDVVVKLDLEAFFAAITAGRIYGVLRSMGYPEAVAHTVTGLVTTVVPLADRRAAPQALRDEDLASRRRLLGYLARPHLPQGSPTSPALANLVAYRLDSRLTGLASTVDAHYTRYADDLAFSLDGPDAARRARRLVDAARAVVRAEGFRVNEAKTRIVANSQRQQLCGVVVNERSGVRRASRDELRAILHNCARLGPEAQNRSGHSDFRAHLLGRIAWVAAVNPSQAERLRAQFDRIEWPAI